MKVKILQDKFSKALSIASRFTSNRAQLPVLANILLKAEKNTLTVSSTNLETSVSINVGAKIQKEGEVTVPSKTLFDVVNNLKTETIDLVGEKEQILIKSDSFESTVLGMNSSDFPETPSSLGKGIVSVEAAELVSCLSKTLFSVSVDETRPILTGALMALKKGKMEVVSTDGFRLSRKSLKATGSFEKFEIIVPKNILSEMLKLSASVETVRFAYKKNESQIIFEVGDTILSSRVIEGEFPDYNKIIPKDSKIDIIVDKEELLNSVKLASVFSRDSSNIVKFKLKKNTLYLEAESKMYGHQKSSVDVKVEKGKTDKEYEILFNHRFLEDFLNAAESEDVVLKFNDPNSSGVFLDTTDPKYLHLIMPVKMQS